jgi:glycosyltransferase involved in cell wall biosynthesis
MALVAESSLRKADKALMKLESNECGRNAERRILVDATMATTGGGITYLVNLLPLLSRLAPHWRFRVTLQSSRPVEALSALPNVEIQFLGGARLRRFAYSFVGGPLEARRWGADLYFSVAETAPPIAPCPVVASFRNQNVFVRDHGWTARTRIRLGLLRAIAQLSAWRCDGVLFVSHDSARDMGAALGLPESKAHVVHHGIDHEAWKPQSRPRLRDRPYILSVSSIYRYKNFVRLIEAYAALARRRNGMPDLVIVGDDQDPEYSRRMREARDQSGVAEQIHLLGAVEYESVQNYYAGAELFVFVSHLESFGHPLLEGMASGVPVVASDMPVFREIGGEAVLYVDPFDVTDIARGLERALDDADLRADLLRRSSERVRQFTWQHSAEKHLEILAGFMG